MAITAAERTELLELVVLMFNAAPGATYLNDLVNLYEFFNGDLQAVAETLDDLPQFKGSAEFPGVHPDSQTDEEFIAAFLGPLGLVGDDLAESFIQEKLDANWSKGDIIYAAYVELNAVTDEYAAQYVNARDILANKVEVATYYSAPAPTGVGVNQTDLTILQSVLDGVTADDNTVTTAVNEINAGTRGVPGVEVTLRPVQDDFNGGNAADLVHGIFGDANATYTAGDDLDGGAGFDTLDLVATGTTASAAISVDNFERITIQDTVGATFNALLVQDSPSIVFTNTVDDQTSKVTNGSTAATYGLAGKGNLTVDFTTTTGTADKAMVVLEGVGTSASNTSTIDVADGSTIESVSIDATGTNFATIAAGTAAGTVTITGDGTNTFAFSSIKSTSTIDASATTGTNTFVLGTTFGNGDVVKGGTGTDTVEFNAKTAIGIVTLTGVETLKADIDVDATLNLGSSTDLKTLTFAGGSGNATVTNAPATLTTINIASVAALFEDTAVATDDTTRNDYTIKYASGVTAPVTVNLSATSSVKMDQLTIEGASALTLNAAADKTTTVDDVHLTDDLTALTISVGAGADFDLGDVSADGSEGVTVSVTVGDEASAYIGGISADSFGDITATVGEDGSAGMNVYALAGGIGNIAVTVGEDGYFSGWFGASAGGDIDEGDEADIVEIGNVTMDILAGASGYFGVDAYSGNVGDIEVNVGEGAYFSGYVEAWAAIEEDDDSVVGGGNVGNVTMNIIGSDASGYLYISAGHSYDGEDLSGGEAASVGNVSLTVSGDDSVGYIYVENSAGSIGDVLLDVTGNDASGYIDLHAASGYGFDGEVASIGNVTMNVGDSASGYIEATASGSIGTSTVTLGEDASGTLYYYSYYADEIGDVTVTGEDGAYFSGYFYTSSGDMGAADITVGENGEVDVELDSDTVGLVTVNHGGGDTSEGGNEVTVTVNADSSAEGVILTGGEDAEASVSVNAESVGVIDLSGWLGEYTITTSITQGTTIIGGADGGSIDGTGEADNLTGGAGNDTIDGNAGADVLVGGAGNDDLSGGSGADDINGGTGDDTLYGGTEADSLNGAAGNDSLQGDAGNDTLLGDAGTDALNGGAGNDQLNGGAGVDTYHYAASGDSAAATVTESGTTEVATITEAAGDVITGDVSDKIDLAGAWTAVAATTVLVDGAIPTATYATAALDAFVYRDGSNFYLAYETAVGAAGDFGTMETVQLVGVVDANDTFAVSATGVVTFTSVA